MQTDKKYDGRSSLVYGFEIHKNMEPGRKELFANGCLYYLEVPKNCEDMGEVMFVTGLAMMLIEDGLEFKERFHINAYADSSMEFISE